MVNSALAHLMNKARTKPDISLTQVKKYPSNSFWFSKKNPFHDNVG